MDAPILKRLRSPNKENLNLSISSNVSTLNPAYISNTTPSFKNSQVGPVKTGKYGSVTKEYELIRAHRMQMLNDLQRQIEMHNPSPNPGVKRTSASPVISSSSTPSVGPTRVNPGQMLIYSDKNLKEIVVLDSDGEEELMESCNSKLDFQKLLSDQFLLSLKRGDLFPDSSYCEKPAFDKPGNDEFATENTGEEMVVLSSPLCCETNQGEKAEREGADMESRESDVAMRDADMIDERVDSGEPLRDAEATADDDLDDLWRDMSLAIEFSKSSAGRESIPLTGISKTQKEEEEEEEEEDEGEREECVHSCVMMEDLGLVCRICGEIQKSIESIFEFQWSKTVRSLRTYPSGPRNLTDITESTKHTKLSSEQKIIPSGISIHPKHLKLMRPHQLEGFNFLVKNLISENPGGCILAHAPGSGKTFMLISFIQSFLSKYPSLRPLIVLPKGILESWKKEFKTWQVENIPLYDFYSSRADNRSQQLEVLQSWEANKSILFLGYQQFACIISDASDNSIAKACQEKLLRVPGLLILDEGHTPRNESTDLLSSLEKVQTPRKVVLTGTLFQNHVREVFSIVNLVHPKFLKMERSKGIVKRILSRVDMSGKHGPGKNQRDKQFCELVEETLQIGERNNKTKVAVIGDLRELTQQVLHYYRGDFLDELPGLVDFTVLLNLSPRQRESVKNLWRLEKFKRNAACALVCLHPCLHENNNINQNMDWVLSSMDIREGVKAKFILNLLSIAESTGEKVLVFGQYVRSLRLLEKLLLKTKGWVPGKESFLIYGKSSQQDREWSMERFNSSRDARVLFGSIKACGEGISLVGASRLVLLDVHPNPSVTRQAIGRAFRPGQTRKVYCYRLVAAESPEEEEQAAAGRKELISKMWFEWNESENQGFEWDPVDVANSGDLFLESPLLREDIKALYRR